MHSGRPRCGAPSRVGQGAPRTGRRPEQPHHHLRDVHELRRLSEEARSSPRVRHRRPRGATPLWARPTPRTAAARRRTSASRIDPKPASEVCKTLLAAGANLHLTTEDGSTPLMAAAGLGRATYTPREPRGIRSPTAEQAVKVLLDAGADINAVNEADFTALARRRVSRTERGRPVPGRARRRHRRARFQGPHAVSPGGRLQAVVPVPIVAGDRGPAEAAGRRHAAGGAGTVQERARNLSAEAQQVEAQP